jgi:hypothetical protein
MADLEAMLKTESIEDQDGQEQSGEVVVRERLQEERSGGGTYENLRQA